MKRDQELEKFYKDLRTIGEQSPMGVPTLSHKRGNNCNEELIVDYVSGVLSLADTVVAERSIFSCGRCTALAVEMAKLAQNFPDDKTAKIEKDVAEFETWKRWFAARNSYDIAKHYSGVTLRFEGVRGWDARIHNAKQDFQVRVGKRIYVPDVSGIINYPDVANAILKSSESPAVNIREFAGVAND